MLASILTIEITQISNLGFFLLMEFDEPDPSCWDRPRLEGYHVYIYDLILFIYLFLGEVLGDLPYDNIGPFIYFSLGDIYLEKR